MASFISRFFGNSVSNATGVAIGSSTARTLDPFLQDLTNARWKAHPVVPPDPIAMAVGVAQGQVDEAQAREWAAENGFGDAAMTALIDVAMNGPGVSEAFTLWRRGFLTEAGFRRAAKREGLEGEWIDALVKAFWNLLTPGELAAAIHRGLVPDPGLLRGEQPQPPFNVEAYPVYQIDALAEAQGSGFDHDRLGVLVGLQGLPMGVIEAANAFYRGIITHGDYIRAFNESNNRNEWADAVLEYARQIPTARDFLENALRGHHPLSWAQDQVKRHGMSDDDALILWQNQGRPLNLHQITQGLAWGGKYNPAAGDNPDPWRQAVLLGAVRPEYYDLQESLKYNLPSAFYFRALQQQGVLTVDEAVTWYKRLGWPPDLAQKVADAYGKDSTAAVNPYVTKAQTQLWTTQHTSYKNAESGDVEAKKTFDLLAIPAAAQTEILKYWHRERELERKQLTPTQIKKAWAKAETNPATGQPWTRDEALERLIAMGYPPNDANSLLDL